MTAKHVLAHMLNACIDKFIDGSLTITKDDVKTSHNDRFRCSLAAIGCCCTQKCRRSKLYHYDLLCRTENDAVAQYLCSWRRECAVR